MIAWLLSLVVLLAPPGQVQRDAPAQRGGASSIRGVVVSADSSHTPIRHALVTLTGPSGGTIITNDAGAFRFSALAEGRYHLAVSKPGYAASAYGDVGGEGQGVTLVLAAGQEIGDLRVPIARGAVITGVVTGAVGEPLAHVPVTASRVLGPQGRVLIDRGRAITDDDGAYRIFGLAAGAYVVTAWPNAPKLRDALGQSFPPTSHPNVIGIADASAISVSVAEERTGVDISLRPAEVATVSGAVYEADGSRATNVSVSLRSSGLTYRIGSGDETFDPDTQKVLGDGTFAFTSISPGRYTLTAFRGGPAERPTETPLPVEWARAELSIDGQSQTGISLNLRKGTPVSGRAVLDLAAPRGDRRFTVQLVGDVRSAGGNPVAVVNDDGTWKIDGVVPGRYVLQPDNRQFDDPSAGIIRSAMINGRDDLATPIDVGAEAVGGITVTITDKIGGARGRLTNGSGAAAMGYRVVLFATDRATSATSPTWFVATPDSNGDWISDRMLAGEYRVAAVANFPQDTTSITTLLDQLLPSSVPITVTTRTLTTIDLRVGG